MGVKSTVSMSMSASSSPAMRVHAALGVTHGRGRIAVDGAEVALAVDERVAQRKGLRHADQGVVDGGVAVGMVDTHALADDLGGLGVLLVVLEAHLLMA